MNDRITENLLNGNRVGFYAGEYDDSPYHIGVLDNNDNVVSIGYVSCLSDGILYGEGQLKAKWIQAYWISDLNIPNESKAIIWRRGIG